MESFIAWLQASPVHHVLSEWLNAIGKFVLDWPELVAFEAGCLALTIGLVWLMRSRKKPPALLQGEEDEMKRRVQLESIYADKVHDFMLDMLTKGEITRKEYKRDCKRFGVAFRLLDLLRSPRSKIGIKHRILRNVQANHSTLQFIKPPPGPKPGADVPAAPVKRARKVYVVVGKRRDNAA